MQRTSRRARHVENIDNGAVRVGHVDGHLSAPDTPRPEQCLPGHTPDGEVCTLNRLPARRDLLSGDDVDDTEDLVGQSPVLCGAPPSDVAWSEQGCGHDPGIFSPLARLGRLKRNCDVPAWAHTREPAPSSECREQTARRYDRHTERRGCLRGIERAREPPMKHCQLRSPPAPEAGRQAVLAVHRDSIVFRAPRRTREF